MLKKGKKWIGLSLHFPENRGGQTSLMEFFIIWGGGVRNVKFHNQTNTFHYLHKKKNIQKIKISWGKPLKKSILKASLSCHICWCCLVGRTDLSIEVGDVEDGEHHEQYSECECVCCHRAWLAAVSPVLGQLVNTCQQITVRKLKFLLQKISFIMEKLRYIVFA